MEIKVQDKGRITLPLSIRKVLGIKEYDTIVLDVEDNKIVLKPKKVVRVKELKGIAKIGKVKLEDIEEALGR